MRKELKLKNQMEELERVNLFVEEIGEELGLDMELQMNLNLVIEEMVVNVISYAYPEGRKADIELVAESDGKELTFVLTDSGKEFDPTTMGNTDMDARPGGHGNLYRKEYHERGHLPASGRQEPVDNDKKYINQQ